MGERACEWLCVCVGGGGGKRKGRLGDRPAAGVATIGGSISAAPHTGEHHVRTL